MLISMIISYFPYAFVTAFTPGPNNIITLYAVSQGGRRNLPESTAEILSAV